MRVIGKRLCAADVSAFYLLFRHMRGQAFALTLKLGFALPDHPSVRIVGVPYFGPVDGAAVPAEDLSRKAAGAELSPAGVFAPPHFQLYCVPFCGGDDGGMAPGDVVLRHFSFVYLYTLAEEIYGKCFLQAGIP